MGETSANYSDNMEQDLEGLQQSNVLSDDMIRRNDIGTNQFEIRVQNQDSNNIEDLKNYIQHERKILEIEKKYRNKKNSNLEEIKKIKRLYELGLQTCSTDYLFHMDFIQFCKENGFATTASQAINNMLKLFAYKPEVWKLASQWYCNIKDFKSGMQVLKKGVEYNPESALLYDSIIDMNLLNILSSSNGKEELVCGEIENINTNTDAILNNIKNFEYIISVLQKLQEYNSTKDAQNKIVEHLYKHHSNEEEVWHIMAQRERKGMHFETDFKVEYKAFEYPYLMYCMGKYSQGLQIVENERKRKLWFLCITTLNEIKNESENNKDLTNKVLVLLLDNLNKAHRSNYLEECHYKLWASLMSDRDARKLLQEATDSYPQSEELWKLRLKYAILSDKIRMINYVFYNGIKELKEKSLGLWLILLEYFMLVSDDSTIIWIFEDAIKQPPEISGTLKPKYIHWLAFNMGIEQARENYRIIARQAPFCKELHQLMSRLELSQLSVNPKSWREVHTLAYEQFGATDVDVGINYIKFLLYLKPEDYESKIAEIYNEVKVNLPDPLWPEFSESYEKLMERN